MKADTNKEDQKLLMKTIMIVKLSIHSVVLIITNLVLRVMFVNLIILEIPIILHKVKCKTTRIHTEDQNKAKFKTIDQKQSKFVSKDKNNKWIVIDKLQPKRKIKNVQLCEFDNYGIFMNI